MSDWKEINNLPPENVVVETKIDDALGCRNVCKLKRRNSLYYSPDGYMYVYYQPTHWRPIEQQPLSKATELVSRITNYLISGGLFNPEHMEHVKVRDLLIECRDALALSDAAVKDALKKIITLETALERKALAGTPEPSLRRPRSSV